MPLLCCLHHHLTPLLASSFRLPQLAIRSLSLTTTPLTPFPLWGIPLCFALIQINLLTAYIITVRGFAKHCWMFALISLCGWELSNETSLQTRWRDEVSLGVWAQVMAATSVSTTSQSEMAMLPDAVKSSTLLETDYSPSAYSNWCLHCHRRCI